MHQCAPIRVVGMACRRPLPRRVPGNWAYVATLPHSGPALPPSLPLPPRARLPSWWATPKPDPALPCQPASGLQEMLWNGGSELFASGSFSGSPSEVDTTTKFCACCTFAHYVSETKESVDQCVAKGAIGTPSQPPAPPRAWARAVCSGEPITVLSIVAYLRYKCVYHLPQRHR